jgi:hypothetical protein
MGFLEKKNIQKPCYLEMEFRKKLHGEKIRVSGTAAPNCTPQRLLKVLPLGFMSLHSNFH